MVKIDVFVAKSRPYDASALVRRVRGRIEDLGIDAATPEDVVLSKLKYQGGGRVSERQWGDVLGLLRIHRGALDLTYLRRWAADLAVTDLLDRALAEA